MTKIVNDSPKRTIDTYAAGNLHNTQSKTLDSSIRYGMQSGYAWSPDYSGDSNIKFSDTEFEDS